MGIPNEKKECVQVKKLKEVKQYYVVLLEVVFGSGTGT